MKPRRTPECNGVFELPGGNEDNSLWVHRTIDTEGTPLIISTWELTEEERKRVREGERVCLPVVGTGHPPVGLILEGDLYEERRYEVRDGD